MDFTIGLWPTAIIDRSHPLTDHPQTSLRVAHERRFEQGVHPASKTSSTAMNDPKGDSEAESPFYCRATELMVE